MFLRSLSLSRALSPPPPPLLFTSRGLVSPAFSLQEEWHQRLDSKVIRPLQPRLGEFFVQVDRKFSAELSGSAVDVDIFANAATAEGELEQAEELVHKLRRTPHTLHTPPSTNHALIRAMAWAGEEQVWHLVRMLEDRTNYGVFLDDYSAVLLLDKLLEDGLLSQGARVASQLMLQEDTHPAANAMGNLACWRYLNRPDSVSWFIEEELASKKEEGDPEEVIRVRVREGPPHFGMVPNEYMDDHFDLREPDQILGKSLWHFNKGAEPLDRSLRALGLLLWGKEDQALEVLTSGDLVEEVCDHVTKVTAASDQVVEAVRAANMVSMNVEEELVNRCKQELETHEEGLMETQRKLYTQWSEERERRIEEEMSKLEKRKKLEFISHVKEELSREEERLFFFDNKDSLDHEQEKKVANWKRTFPRRSWPGTKGYFRTTKWVRTPGKEMKTPRWQVRETKMGPPK